MSDEKSGKRKRPKGDDIAKEAKSIIPEVVYVGAGRPTSYKYHYCESLIKHMSEGLSFESFAAMMPEDDGTFSRASVSTLYQWEKNFSEFSEAKKIGEAACLLFWEKLGIMGASGKFFGFNAAVYIFNKKNRFGWKDKHELKVDDSKDEKQKTVIILPSNGREKNE